MRTAKRVRYHISEVPFFSHPSHWRGMRLLKSCVDKVCFREEGNDFESCFNLAARDCQPFRKRHGADLKNNMTQQSVPNTSSLTEVALHPAFDTQIATPKMLRSPKSQHPDQKKDRGGVEGLSVHKNERLRFYS